MLCTGFELDHYRPFESPSQAALISAILSHEPAPASLPPALERTLKKCLTKDPDRRWQTASDLRDELEWIAQGGEAAPRATDPQTRRTMLR